MKITRGEVHWLQRRRAGLTQEAAAGLNRMSVGFLSRIERDRAASSVCFSVMTPALTPGEYGALMRRRSGLSVERIARYLRVSETTAKRMERDRTRTAYRLIDLWKAIGPIPPSAAAPVRIGEPSRKRPRDAAPDRGGRPRTTAGG